MVTVFLVSRSDHNCLMARIARIVVPGLPHHVTQRGNPRGQVFLMPNHVHFILVPSEADGLRRTFADLHRRYTGDVNA